MAIKIFIDQGHNPRNPNAGAEGFGIREQDITYQVGRYLADMLEKDSRFEVRLSRPNPDVMLGTTNSTSLDERVDAANNWPANYFISIHTNANVDSNVNGTEVYVYQSYAQSYYFGEHILNAIVKMIGTKNNGVIVRPGLYILSKTIMPSVLVELAYITNYEDSEKLKSEQYQFAAAMYKGILNYFGF